MRWGIVVLAAGQGKRMKSRLPKVLHPLCGVELLQYVLENASRVAPGAPCIVVVPPEHHQFQSVLAEGVRLAVQREPRGTADAVAQAQIVLQGQVDVLMVLNGDVPLLLPGTLQRLRTAFERSGAMLALLTAPAGLSAELGRICRDSRGRVVAVMEAAELPKGGAVSPEVNVGAYCFQMEWLGQELPQLAPAATGELYLTSLISRAASQEGGVADVAVSYPWEGLGINTRVDLAKAEAVLRQRIRERWMLEGVTLEDPDTVYIDAQVAIGQDTRVGPNTFLLGRTAIGEGCVIGPNSVIRDSVIGPGCRVLASVVEDSTLEEGVDVGPFSHLREGAYLERGVHVGNFGEVKQSRLGRGVKMGHFSYIGDATLGAEVNVGAGAITCNFDGVAKHRTEVGEGAFIGSDTMLIAPVKVGARARTGAGSVVTKDVPPNTLVVGAPARVRKRRSTSAPTGER